MYVAALLHHFKLPSLRSERYIIGCRHNLHQEGEKHGDEASSQEVHETVNQVGGEEDHEKVGEENREEDGEESGQEDREEVREKVGEEVDEANGPRQALGTARLAGSAVVLTLSGVGLILKADESTARPPLSRGGD